MPDDNVIDLAAHRRRHTPEVPVTIGTAALVRITTFGFGDWAGVCDGLVHWFTKVPGPCQCGQETWDGEP